MNSWKVILATLIIFGAGVVTGGLLVSYADRVSHVNSITASTIPPAKPSPNPQAILTPWQLRNRELLRRMDRDLGLTPEQHRQIEKYIVDSAQRTESLWKPILPQMRKETQRLHHEIRDELTLDQQKKFDEFYKGHAGQNNRRSATNQPPAAETNSPPAAVPANP